MKTIATPAPQRFPCTKAQHQCGAQRLTNYADGPGSRVRCTNRDCGATFTMHADGWKRDA